MTVSLIGSGSSCMGNFERRISAFKNESIRMLVISNANKQVGKTVISASMIYKLYTRLLIATWSSKIVID